MHGPKLKKGFHLKTIVNRIEDAKNVFNCTSCTESYSFPNWNEFCSHSCISESADKYFECIYCGLLISLNNGERHINMHFQHQYNNLYQCSLCSFSTSAENRFIKHIKCISHVNMNPIFKCRCCEQEFNGIENLIQHVKFYTVAMFNCCMKNCIVRSRFKNVILNHYQRCHPSKNQNLEITLFLSCNEKSPDVLFTNQLMEKYIKIQRNGIQHQIGTSVESCNRELYLKCPKCPISTLSWSKFIRHFFICKNHDNNTKDIFIYICSFCHTISTEKHLIEEHVVECNKEAFTVEEELPTLIDNEICKPVSLRSNKRSISMSNCEVSTISPPSKRARTNDSSESKCKTEEAIISEEGEAMEEEEETAVSEVTTECVYIPFDEDAFCANNTLMPPNQRDSVINKMRQFSKYQVKIVGKENYGRIPQCPECNKIFNYGFGDFKRHFIAVHLDVEKDCIKECLKYTKIPKIGDKYQELSEQLAMRNMRPRNVENDRVKIPLPYSISGLKKLTEFLPIATQHYLAEKMRLYSTMSVNIQNFDNTRRFMCNQCSYSSPYALADVRKHIMGSHCGISTKHFRFCLQASRLDPNEFLLLSDDKILTFAKDVVRRASKNKIVSYSVNNTNNTTTNTTNNTTTNTSTNTTNNKTNTNTTSTNNNNNNIDTTVVETPKLNTPSLLSTNSINGMYTRSQKYSWSSKRKKNYKNIVAAKENVSSTNHKSLSVVKIENTSNQVPVPSPSLGGRKGVNALYLNADTSCNLPLPYSENVLRILLPTMVLNDQIPNIIQKMKLYSNYTLKRLCKNERTVAFQCPCGRVFHTARIPDLKMRAATLADARRHVMGVHAKIPQSLITLCCQASRICRENDFQIYSDDMLLQLASERQGKLPESTQIALKEPTRNNDSKTTDNICQLKFAPLKMEKRVEVTEPINVAPINNKSKMNGNSNNKHEEIEKQFIDGEISSPIPSILDNSISSSLENTAPAHKSTNSFLNSSYHDDESWMLNKLPFVSDDLETSNSQIDENATARLETEKAKVERVINLPYSLEALKCLTDGYCEPSFFPVLQEKMEIYSRYKIFIIRRENRRVFCCSGCPSSSPHGMGDVKKHILGVHARIPERFKAAAMHCSRLSREDTSLLPDHLLLQLAKMKWKGSVIKPLSELSLEDRIKTFSKKNWDTKPKTFSNRSSKSYSMVGIKPTRKTISSTSNSVSQNSNNKHVNDRLSLKCEPKLEFATYINQYHSTTATTTDELIDEHLNMSGASEIIIPEEFHVEILQHTTNEEISYKCSMCEYESRFVGNTKGHIVREHLGIPPHSCNICEQLFNSRACAEAHHEKDHSDASFTLAHYGPYKIAMSKIAVQEMASLAISPLINNSISGTNTITTNFNSNNLSNGAFEFNNGDSGKNTNSFLQNDFDLCLI